MSEFHFSTLSAAKNILEKWLDTHDRVDDLIFEWGCSDYISGSTISRKLLQLVEAAKKQNISVRTEQGELTLSRAIIEKALKASPRARSGDSWIKLLAGLRFDGFELIEELIADDELDRWSSTSTSSKLTLRRMLPDNVPEANFREAESEVEILLDRHGFQTAKGHLSQAITNFSQGNWSSANAMIRDFYQELLDKIAEYFGCDPALSDDAKRQYLAKDESGPFLFNEYNEWENDRGRPSYVPGLWARLHPHGSHPGLSDEEDCAFRFQIILITARLFLRRFDQRVK